MVESKRQQWIQKMKNSENMVWIDNNMSNNIRDVAFHIWDMYDSDFHLSIADICNILLCDRRWVVNNIKDNVKHIFLNDFIRDVMMNQCERQQILKDYYYFSEQDFYRWLSENIIAERQTINIDLGNHTNNPMELKRILVSYEKALSDCRNNIEIGLIKLEFYKLINDVLDSNGKMLFSKRVSPYKRDLKYIKVHSDIPKKFTSLKEIKGNMHKDRPINNEIVYRKLYMCGAIRYTIYNKKLLNEENKETRLIRFDNSCFCIPEGLYNISVPYGDFMKIDNN